MVQFKTTEQQRERSRIYYKNNRDKMKTTVRLYRRSNQEKITAYGKTKERRNRQNQTGRELYSRLEWRVAKLQKTAEYRKRNPEVIRACANRRRELDALAKGTHTIHVWMQRVAYYGWRCHYCKEPLSVSALVKEHRIPLSRGGTGWAANLVPSCQPCNTRKRSMTESEFRERLCTVASASVTRN